MVTRKHVQGGFHIADQRIRTELERLEEGGQKAILLENPLAVIYKALPVTLPGATIAATDVMVPVPAGYPARQLDLAFLPSDSPLINMVKGVAQTVISAGGRSWRQMSYHPHNGGGAPPWNPNHHGFHSYVDELISWLGSHK